MQNNYVFDLGVAPKFEYRINSLPRYTGELGIEANVPADS